VETAVKLARQVHVESGKASRVTLISRWKSYHGLTLGALAASGRTYFREPFSPLLADAVHIPPPYCLRCSYGLTFPDCGLRCAQALEETIINLGPETVSAFIAEPVSGATLGIYPPPPGYLSLVREICDKNGVILIFDEVMSGMGRTGKWFASQHSGVVPDIMTLGKGLSSGSIALSGVATRSEYLDILRGGSGNFVHGGTFSHHAVATAAGLAVVNILERENLVARCADMGLYLGKRLKELLLPLPFVIDVRGIGLMWGVEFAQDKESGIPFPRNHKLTERVREAMYNRGILVYPASALAGKDGDAIIFGPPFTIDTAEIDLAVETLAEVLKETIGA
jgi:adenosylmethionine-8-amino-7-oxononanoate aminotransferase